MSNQPDPTAVTEPRASRPRLPEGYGVPNSLLPWSFARERLEQAQNYWICTASLDGRPHAAPLWGIWLDDQFIFDGHPATRWGRNILANPYMSLHLENGTEVVMVEGVVEDVNEPDRALYKRAADAYDAKYKFQLPDHGFFLLRPRAALGWTQFPGDATRWTFSQDSTT
ncbi:MAG TPA: pyridoxamine 5'-phosphate oxidase family protein [Roseiflexaceae bacterium]|nr:pyridoxamine 5'-phosphate oxidase family protein [Roseiflexaceae bacterium]